jgi:simple sugar transport system permease protein
MSEPMTTQQPVMPEPEAKPGANRWEAWLPTVKDTVAAIVLALVVGALLIIFSTPRVIESLSYVFSYPWDFFKYAAIAVWDGYSALLRGSIGSPGALVRTLERAAPLICAGLGVSLAFRAGMFNIGAQGQMLVGGILCGYIGFHYDLPVGLHLLLAILGAVVAAGLWGGIAGFLKARTGAHEVITTIMLNYVGRFLLLYFLAKESFQRPGEDNLLSPPVDDSASFPSIAGVHTGVLLAVLAAVATPPAPRA